jgi:hypothetical protein
MDPMFCEADDSRLKAITDSKGFFCLSPHLVIVGKLSPKRLPRFRRLGDKPHWLTTGRMLNL